MDADAVLDHRIPVLRRDATRARATRASRSCGGIPARPPYHGTAVVRNAARRIARGPAQLSRSLPELRRHGDETAGPDSPATGLPTPSQAPDRQIASPPPPPPSRNPCRPRG